MNREIVPTSNPMVIRAALSIDNSYEKISYDGSPPLRDFDTGNKIWFLLTLDGWTAGIACMVPLNNVLWAPHIVIFKDYRGNGSEEWGKKIISFMKQNFGAKKFLAHTPYVTAKKYAELTGFKHVGTLSRSIMKNGELLDQYTLELGENN